MITIDGWPSFEAWRDADYPGAPSFANPKTSHAARPQQGNEWRRRGLCRITTCNKIGKDRGGFCHEHAIPMRPYVKLADR